MIYNGVTWKVEVTPLFRGAGIEYQSLSKTIQTFTLYPDLAYSCLCGLVHCLASAAVHLPELFPAKDEYCPFPGANFYRLGQLY